jgi:hypothetical protein
MNPKPEGSLKNVPNGHLQVIQKYFKMAAFLTNL